jgi:hypothetical protein
MLFVGGRKNPTCAAEGVFFRSAGPRRGVGGRSDLRFLSVCDLNKKKPCFFLWSQIQEKRKSLSSEGIPLDANLLMLSIPTQIHKNAFHPHLLACLGSVEKCFLLKGLLNSEFGGDFWKSVLGPFEKCHPIIYFIFE